MRKEASRAGAPVVQPIDPFLPETGWPRQIDPAHRLKPAKAADDWAVGRGPIEEERRTDSFAQFPVGDASADRVLQRAYERFMGDRWLRFNRCAQRYAEDFFQEQTANQCARTGGVNVADFSLRKQAAQGHGETRLSQKQVDRHAMRFVGAIVLESEHELAVRLPLRFDRHRVGQEFDLEREPLLIARKALLAAKFANERPNFARPLRHFG